MRGRRYTLEILWSTGHLTEISITEKEKELIENEGSLFILMKYELEGYPEAKPVSFQIWDKWDNPQISAEAMA